MNEYRSRFIFPEKHDVDSRTALDTALRVVPFYRKWRSCDPGQEWPIDVRYSAMPVLTKQDIRSHFPEGMLPPELNFSQSLVEGQISIVETSGTSAERIKNIWNQEWWDASERASWKLNSCLDRVADGRHREAILANPRNVGIISDEADLPMEDRRLARFLYLNEKTDPTRWTPKLMDRMIEELEVYRPAVLEANPSLLARLSRYIHASRRTVFQPAAIVFTYEYPTLLHYCQVRQVFCAEITSSYGSTETGYVFMQCEHGRFHQNSEFCRVDFQPLKVGQGGPHTGRILITVFKNPWSYLIRFDAGDLVTLDPTGKCPCGRDSGLILSHMNGRTASLTVSHSGRIVTLFELDGSLSRLAGVEEYKLIQTGPDRFELDLVSGQGDKQRLTEEARKALAALYGEKSQIAVNFKEAIEPESSGKYLNARALFPIHLEDHLDPDGLPPR
jgi:phenylacetate-coenzyme A ligase PaaK-like adenylate-forming protein